MSKLEDAIRAAMLRAEEAGTTRYRMSLETGISQAQLSRFVNGERGLGVETAERLAEYLGLEIVIRPKRRRKAGE